MTLTKHDIDALLGFHRATFGDARMEDPPAPSDPPAGPPAPAPSYTAPASQADLDRIINERLTRERAKYADHADLKAKAAELEQIKAANATEQEKAVKAAVDDALKVERQRSNSVLISAEARALAAAAKFRDPGDAVRFLDLTQIKVGDDGAVDQAAIKAALDTLGKEKAYLLADETPAPPPPFNGGPRPGGPPAPAATPQGRLRQSIEADIAAASRP